jgi:choline dehydrogenase-like flavoprotein
MEMGAKAMTQSTKNLIGIMTKSVDDPAGRVFPDGSVSKPVTEADRKRLDEGAAISREILLRAGASPSSIVVTNPAGAHHGNTAAIGKVVDKDLQTEIDGLFACDGSVLPKSPGLPPIVTIVALAKRLAKTLV